MEDKLFDTEQKRAKAIVDLQSGLDTPFWNLMRKIIDGNIDIAKLQLEEGTGEDEETPESIARIRDRLRLFREIKATPEVMIKKLQAEEKEPDELDPYDTVESSEVDKKE